MRLSAACRPLVVGFLLSVVTLLLLPRLAVAQVMQPMCVSGCITCSVDVPNTASKTWGPNTSGHTAGFLVWNKGSSADEYSLSCSRTSPVTSCSVSVADIVLDPGEKWSVTVTYNVGSPGTGSSRLTANGTGDDDSGTGTVYVVGPPTINVASPGSGSSVAVHNRQPIIRAYFAVPAGDQALIDLTTFAAHSGYQVTGAYNLEHGTDQQLLADGCLYTCQVPGRIHAQLGWRYQERKNGVPAEVLMAHELGHAYGTLPWGIHDGIIARGVLPDGRIWPEPADALFYENRARAIFGCHSRPSYGPIPPC